MAEELPAIQDDIVRNRAVGLFAYLKKLAELRSKNIYNVDEYDEHIWFSDVPKEPECFTPAWGGVKPSQEETWLGVRKVIFFKPPLVPAKIQPWVNEQDLLKSSDIPDLQERIIVPQVEGAGQEPQYLNLSDCPHISEQWERYIDEKWLPWAEENERLLRIQDIYSKLHAIYQLQKALGEAYELVIGFGVVSWKTPSNNLVRRPLIVAQADVELNTKTGNLYVKQAAEGTKLAFEEDMLDLPERCKPDIYNIIRQQVSEIGDEIWNVAAIEIILRTWVHSVSAAGVYSPALEPFKEFPANPHVTFAPILILRKRNSKSLLRALEVIRAQIDNIKNSSDIPFNIRRSIEIIDDKETPDDSSSSTKEFIETYFPLPSNDEQRKIVEELRNRKGVVVQGPPGTGKSHTIANLICHLLAEGKRILVTSQTPRALKVLKKMIPKEVAALCVNQLGRDKDALAELEKSARGIDERKNEFNSNSNKRTVELLRRQLDELRRRKADLERQLREIRERETYEHRICDGAYCGTAQQIAKQVSSESDKHSWLNIVMPAEITPPLSDEEMAELVRLYQGFSQEDVMELEREFIQINKLPTRMSRLTLKID